MMLLPISGKSTMHLLMLLLHCCGCANSMFMGADLSMLESVMGDAFRTIDATSIPAGRSSGIAERILIAWCSASDGGSTMDVAGLLMLSMMLRVL